MANPREATVTNISNKPQTIEEILATVASLKAEAERQIKEANALAEKHAGAFAEKKSEAREKAISAVNTFKTLASPEEWTLFRRDLGMGRKGGKRKSTPCTGCGKSRHGKANTCSGKK